MGPILRNYATTLAAGTAGSDLIRVSLRKAGTGTFATGSDWSPGAGDVKVSKGGGAEANIGTLPAYSNGAWEFTLTDTELTAKMVRIRVSDAAVDDEDITIETFGHASAMYPQAYSIGTAAALFTVSDDVGGNVTGSVGSVNGDIGGDLNGNVTGSVAAIGTGAITTASFSAGAIDAAALAADAGTEIGTAVWATTTRLLTAGTNIVLAKGTGVTGFNDIAATAIVSSGAINTSGGAVSTVTTVGTLTTYTGNTPQTGDAYARLGAPAGASIAADVAAVKTDTGNLVTRITSTLFSGITSLAEWLGLIAGKQTGNSTARTEVRATGAGSGTYDETTDSQQAIRDRGDAEWTGGGGGGGVAGEGADQCTLHFAVSGVPIADADVWVTTDAAGAEVTAGTLQTDSGGDVTFLLDAGSQYFIWMQKDGKNPIIAEPYTAVAD